MIDLPRLLNERGELNDDIDTSAMDAPTLARLDAFRDAYLSHKRAQEALAAAFAEVDSALASVKNTEEFYDAHWPKETFLDLWRANFGGGPRNRMAGRF